MANGEFRPVYHPAGHDNELRAALQELRTGRWLAMRDLLARTPDWARWTQRTQVLGAVAAGSDAVRAWLTEEPGSAAAFVMRARVAVERAVRANRAGHPSGRELWQEGWEACRSAAHAAPADPVPWVCLLALSQLDDDQRLAEHRMPPPGPMLFPGPWGLLAEADRRDPHNREAYHRMLQFVYARRAGSVLSEAVNFVQWASSTAPEGSSLHVLPLYVRVERYRREHDHDKALDLHWVTEDAEREALRALEIWYHRSPAATRTLPDLNHLAHALWGALRFAEAAVVFRELGPYFTSLPWACRSRTAEDAGGAEEVFVRARARALAAGSG
ncbi:hypothetical protein [Streptomyces sp. NPDC047803]|uniref:hypothetical protein n=1 Tax=Streptomyces TaxID=1883 RepID=UPI0033FA7902